jgi:hypothetical protein
MKLSPWLFLAIGVGLSAVSRSLELQGDAAPYAESGVSTARLMFHLPALVLLVGALTCFVAALWIFIRRRRS